MLKTWRHWRAVTLVRLALIWTGAATVITLVWLLAGFPIGIDAWLDVTTAPAPVDAIVCIGGGTMSHDLPTMDGWRRIYTAVQLHADGYAPLVVFTGRGNSKVSEAEIYADAAAWLGMPRAAMRLDPLAASTAEHPESLLKSLTGQIDRQSRLLLVTSQLHSRRVLMSFRKRGFVNVTAISDYTARNRPRDARRRETSALESFRSDNKSYSDPLFLLAHQTTGLFIALRECAAIAVYRWKGQV
jgi:uncharacterized SAM-binding protein YcdF (DUF218 family)